MQYFLASAEPEPDSILKVQIKIIHITAAIRDKMNKFGFQAMVARHWVTKKAKRRFSVFLSKSPNSLKGSPSLTEVLSF